MLKINGKWRMLNTLLVVLLLAIGLLALFYSETGMTNEIGAERPASSEYDFAAIPQSVVEDANALAKELMGESQESYQDLVNQLLTTYIETKDKDFVVLFNPGGWGWKLIDNTPGWSTIIDGIKSELEGLGYSSIALNYQRTSGGLIACIKEFIEGATNYPKKAKVLARRVEFLTTHVPNLRVIVAGESNGTVIVDSTMGMLQDNQQVYSIRTGTPFWHKPVSLYRTLLMNSNGKTVDTFSYGKIRTMLWTTLKGLFGLEPPEKNPGTVLSWLRAPGHDYSWQYPGVCSAIEEFLEENFGSEESVR